MTQDFLNGLLSKTIHWNKHPQSDRYHYVYHNDELILLRMNDFPDEPLWTLISELELLNFDDTPKGWQYS